MLTIEEAIEKACSIMGLAYHSIRDYEKPSDGFCLKCPARARSEIWNFENDGHILDYMRTAVVEKLKRDGHEIAYGCDEEGREQDETED